jgi:hypothetical protein
LAIRPPEYPSGAIRASSQAEGEGTHNEPALTASVGPEPAKAVRVDFAKDMLELAQTMLKDPKKKKRPLDPSMFAVVVHLQRLGGVLQLGTP